MSKIVLFKIIKGEDNYYVATATDFGIVTQGNTFENLLENIKEATELHFEGGDNLQHPVMVNFDLSDMVYA